MITKEPTMAMLQEYKKIWKTYKDILKPNRKTGVELLAYLQENYVLTEIYDQDVLDAITYNTTMNIPYAEKLAEGTPPIPKAFILEDTGNGKKFYRDENKDAIDVWGENIAKILIGIDISSGYYMLEGSTLLWDELCAFQGLDEMDLQNYVCVAEYILALKKFGKLDIVLS